jgi:type II secretory pathway predicted ATPase ExeA
MYTEFYGLKALPFELSPDPRYLMLTTRHREALANLQYGISARKSLTLMTGEAGTGKTTLINAALASPACSGAQIVHLSNSMLTRDEFIEFLADAFQLSTEARHSKTRMLVELDSELRARRTAGITTALVIDEAQCLDRELLEEIRLLSNIETPAEKLLPLVLVGQPEFAERLNQPALRQLKQRVALRCQLGALDAAETAAYVAGRIHIAGGDATTVFTRDAITEIHRYSAGIPRTIGVICDNALVNGFAAGVKPISGQIIRDVCADFDLGRRSIPRPEPLSPAMPADPQPGNSRPAGLHGAPVDGTNAPLFESFGRKRRFSFF